MSAISDLGDGYGQNLKSLEAYEASIEKGFLAVERGHLLTDEDVIIRRHITNLMCNFKTSWSERDSLSAKLDQVLTSLEEMENDGLVKRFATGLEITPKGEEFARNICMKFDLCDRDRDSDRFVIRDS